LIAEGFKIVNHKSPIVNLIAEGFKVANFKEKKYNFP